MADNADVGSSSERAHPGLSIWGREVDGQQPLAGVELLIDCVAAPIARSQTGKPVAARGLNSGDRGAEVTKDLATHGTGHAFGDLQDCEAGEYVWRSHHAVSIACFELCDLTASSAAINDALSSRWANTRSLCSPSKGGPASIVAGVRSNRQCGACDATTPYALGIRLTRPVPLIWDSSLTSPAIACPSGPSRMERPRRPAARTMSR